METESPSEIVLKTTEAMCLLLGLHEKCKEDPTGCFRAIKKHGDITENLAKFDKDLISK
jgi:hypothetical protein